MSTRLFHRRQIHRSIAAGSDEVVAGLELPSGSVIHDIKMHGTVMSLTLHTMAEICQAALEVWILPVLDPDSGSNFDSLVDQLVPKDTDVDTLDLDTGASDTTPFWEPGEHDFGDLLDVGLRPERLYHRKFQMSVASGNVFTFQDNQSPFGVKYFPGMPYRVQIGRRLAVRQPSVLVGVVASPALDDTTGSAPAMLTEAELAQMKYIDHVLERALLHQLGVVETGAETPWEEASALMKKVLEPDVYEDTAEAWASSTIDFFCTSVVDFSVEGDLGNMTLTSGR